MRRRALIVATAVPVASAGCVGWAGRPTQLSDYEFYASDDEELRDYTTQLQEIEGPEDEPMVRFDENAGEVHVYGMLYVGSISCHEASLKEVEYDREESTLHARVGFDQREDAVGGADENKDQAYSVSCLLDLTAQSYLLRVEFEGSLPDRVVATERPHTGDEKRFEADRRG